MKKYIVSFLLFTLLLKADFIETSGDVLRFLIPSLTLGATYYLDDKEGQIEFYKSFATNLIATYALKYSVDKKRPNGDDYSFPSGHTSVTFSSSAFVDKRYGFKYALPLYVASSYTGYSRVESNNHYTIDVVAGAVLGVISSYIFTTKYKGILVAPKINGSVFGFTFTKEVDIY